MADDSLWFIVYGIQVVWYTLCESHISSKNQTIPKLGSRQQYLECSINKKSVIRYRLQLINYNGPKIDDLGVNDFWQKVLKVINLCMVPVFLLMLHF